MSYDKPLVDKKVFRNWQSLKRYLSSQWAFGIDVSFFIMQRFII